MPTNKPDSQEDGPRARECCEVVIVYDGGRSRHQACALCSHLQRRFQVELEFKFTWWKLNFLSDPHIGVEAAHSAAVADVILFSTESDAEVSPEIQAWNELWVPRRSSREGALAAMHLGSGDTGTPSMRWESYLKALAQRTGLDYLPRTQPAPMKDSPEQLQQRAHQSTSTLDSILDRIPPGSHWGINE